MLRLAVQARNRLDLLDHPCSQLRTAIHTAVSSPTQKLGDQAVGSEGRPRQPRGIVPRRLQA